MTESEICKLKIINRELTQIWIQTEKKIKKIESENPDFKKKYYDAYEYYVFMQQYYSLVTFTQGLLEKFLYGLDTEEVD